MPLSIEFVLRPNESDPVARFVREHAFKIMAAHNHELFVEPRFYYMHTFNVGDPLPQARVIREALEKTNSKLSRSRAIR